MSNQIYARKLSTSDINEILMKIQSLSTAELHDTIKIMASDLKNDMKIIRNNYETIDRVNERFHKMLAEKRNLIDKCYNLATEVNELKKKSKSK